AVALGDFDNDGRVDIAAANKVARNVVILLNSFGSGCLAESFGPAARTFPAFDPRALATGDLNNDGVRDVVVASTNINQGQVTHGSPAPTFPTAPTFAPGFDPETSLTGFNSPRAVALGNFNGDAFPDLAVANAGSGLVSIFTGGAGGFSSFGSVAAGAT